MKKNEQFKLLNVILGMITSSVSLLSQQEWLNNKHYERPTFNFDYKKLWNPSSSSSSFIFHPIFPNSESFIVWERNLCGTKQPWPLPVKLWRETWSSFQQQKNATETVFKTFFRSLVSVEERKILPDFEVSTWKVIFFEGKDVASEDIGAFWVVLLLIKWSKKLQRDFQSVRS